MCRCSETNHVICRLVPYMKAWNDVILLVVGEKWTFWPDGVVIVQINVVFCVFRNREVVKTAEVDVLDEAAEGNPEQNLKYA